MTLIDPASQARLIHRAVAQAGLDVADLGYIEAHAAGTPLGDANEVRGLLQALTERPRGLPDRVNGPGGRLWVGSVKANIGHLEGSAGAASLAKAVQILCHRAVPPTLGLTRLNHRIELAGTPVAMADRLVPWPESPRGPRRVGVNSFGVGGANAHLVLEEPPATRQEHPTRHRLAMPVPLSAADDKALLALADSLERFLARDERPSFDAITWTLQTGRERMRSRRILLARDNDELRATVAALAAGTASPAVFAPGDADGLRGQHRAAAAWLAGEDVDWSALWQRRNSPHRVPLVPYPFQRRPFWFAPTERDRAAEGAR